MTERIEDKDWSGVRFKNINFAGAKIVEGNFDGTNFNGYVGSMRVNGIEVWPLMAAEMERRHPERRYLKPSPPEGVREALAIIEAHVDATWTRARTFSEEQLHQQVDEEWSTVETVRHMVMVVDVWLGKNVLGEDDPYHPIGLPPSFLPRKPEGTSIDPDADPSFEQALVVLQERLGRLREYCVRLTADELERAIDVGYVKSVRAAMWIILDELWSHNRFMNRDLDAIESGS